MVFGMETAPSVATAAAASGGDTMAPSAMVAAKGRLANVHPTAATTAVVRITLTSASATSGGHSRMAGFNGKSYAASSSAGAMNSANAVCGSIMMTGDPGIIATATPAATSSAGYGTASCRDNCSSRTAASIRASMLSKYVMKQYR